VAADPGVLAGPAQQRVGAVLMNGEQAGMPVEGLWPGAGECLSLIVPLGNFSVSVVLLVVMSTPPAVNTPWAITVSLVAVAEVDMNWKCSMPEALLLLGAAVAARVPDRAIAPAASMEPAAISRRRWFCAW
jgi:hypothetical protein